MVLPKSDFSLRVLHISPECAPLAKRGGLGDVVGALPKALRKCNVDARVLMPAWPGVMEKAKNIGALSKESLGRISIALNWRAWTAKIYEAKIGRLRVYLLDQPELFSNTEIYPETMTDDDALPFMFLSFAAFELHNAIGWKPQFLHTHDWPTAPVAAALRWHKYYSQFNGDYDTIFTIHNIAHQGLFSSTGLSGWGFSQKAFSSLDPESMEFFGQVNLMKGAVLSADAVTTVSPTYSWDIQTHDGGFGLDGVIGENKNKLQGILNGIDYEVWNPAKDKLIPHKYSADKLSGKTACRKDLLKKSGLSDNGKPVVIFVGRLTEQKGIDIMLETLGNFLPEELNAVIIGSGNEMYDRKITSFADKHKDSAYAFTGFNEETAHLAYAGGDILLMPSLFEPCGLSQLIAFSYGTVPVVRATGGLADTVIDADASPDGTGFVFKDFSISEFTQALRRALDAYKDRQRWETLIKNDMGSDFSWDSSAKAYAELYRSIMVSD